MMSIFMSGESIRVVNPPNTVSTSTALPAPSRKKSTRIGTCCGWISVRAWLEAAGSFTICLHRPWKRQIRRYLSGLHYRRTADYVYDAKILTGYLGLFTYHAVW
jgi:hypothetical protein